MPTMTTPALTLNGRILAVSQGRVRCSRRSRRARQHQAAVDIRGGRARGPPRRALWPQVLVRHRRPL